MTKSFSSGRTPPTPRAPPRSPPPSCSIFPSAQTQRLRQALQASQADRDTARLDKELLAQRLQGLEQEAENKKRSQDDRTRQLKGLEVRVLRGWPAAARVLAQV